MRGCTTFAIILILVLLLSVLGCSQGTDPEQPISGDEIRDDIRDAKLDFITSFEACAAAGNPVMESYPRQCRTPDGQTFVESVEVAEDKPSIDSVSRGFCDVSGVDSVHICGEFVKVVRSPAGAGASYYRGDGTEISCPVVAPDAMSDECKSLMGVGDCRIVCKEGIVTENAGGHEGSGSSASPEDITVETEEPAPSAEEGSIGEASEYYDSISPEECESVGGRVLNTVGGAHCDIREEEFAYVEGFISPTVCCVKK